MKRPRANLKREMILASAVLLVAGLAIAFVVFRDGNTRMAAATSTGNEPPARGTRDVENHEAPAPRNVQPAPTIAPPVVLSERPITTSTPTSIPVRVTQAPQPAKTMTPKADAKPAKPGSTKDGPDRPIARQALDLVGADPLAEAIWADAINDPTVSAHDRQDLIEDLNENGFDDPGHPSADDLPLIENRLAIIEELAPLAMDDVNAAAFAEAYKDLVNMHAKAMAD